MLNYITNLNSQLWLGIISVVIAEIIRDLYHVAGHYWQPLQAGHLLHHKAYRSDLSVVSMEAYRQAQWHNDVPEAIAMTCLSAAIALLGYMFGLGYAMAIGSLYSFLFLVTSVARAKGWLLATDLTHKPGDLTTIPSVWTVNRTYHWRHHFDRGEAYFCSTFTIVDKFLGTALALKGKTIAITGASGALGRSLVNQLSDKGAKVIALTTSTNLEFDPQKNIEIVVWQVGQEADLQSRLQKVDILIINHGVNVHSDRTPEAISKSFEVNTFSAWRLMETFFETVQLSKHKALKEVWLNTSEAEVNPAFSPLYELSKRTLGDLITMRRLSSPCVVRKLVLGAFKSSLNPIGIMSSDFVAWAVLALAQRDFRDIIVTFNPFTYLFFPLKEIWRSLYFRLFSKEHNQSLKQVQNQKPGVNSESH